MSDRTYEDGLRDGQIKAIEAMQVKQGERLDNHSQRLTLLERIVWAVGGIAIFLEVWPSITAFISHNGVLK